MKAQNDHAWNHKTETKILIFRKDKNRQIAENVCIKIHLIFFNKIKAQHACALQPKTMKWEHKTTSFSEKIKMRQTAKVYVNTKHG